MSFIYDRGVKAQQNWESKEFRTAAKTWHDTSIRFDYQYMFEFCGLPIIQDPQDICMLQEVIWKIKPTVVIETGVARGGSLILSAVVLAALSQAAVLNGDLILKRRVIGIDIDLRNENLVNLREHPLRNMIELVEGSSVDLEVVAAVSKLITPEDVVMVILDSNHEENHVLGELMLYSEFVSLGSAMLVMDTGIEFVPPDTFSRKRPWGPGSNPYTASKKFLGTQKGKDFIVDQTLEKRMMITCATEGLLLRTKK